MRRWSARSVALIVVVLLTCGAALSRPSSAAPSPASSGQGAVIYADTFRTLSPTWGRRASRAFVADGHFVVKAAPGEEQWKANGKVDYRKNTQHADIRVDMAAQDADGRRSSGGLIFWTSDDVKSGYELLLDRGYFKVIRLSNKRPSHVIDWTASPVIRTGPGAINRIEVADRGDKAFFVINGYPVGHIDAPALLPGDRIGFSCDSLDHRGGACRFSNLMVRAASAKPPASPAPGQVVYSDDFKVRGSVWGKPDKQSFVKDGQMQIVAPSKRAFWRISSFLHARQSVPRADVHADMIMSGLASARQHGGLLFWAKNTQDFFEFLLDGARRFSVLRRKNGNYSYLIPWTSTDAIKAGKGAVNRIEIIDDGSKAYFLINGIRVGKISAPSADMSDLIGIYCESDDSVTAHCRFSRLVMAAARAANPPPPPPGSVLYSDDFKAYSPVWLGSSQHVSVKGGQMQITTTGGHAFWAFNGSLHARQLAPMVDIHARTTLPTPGVAAHAVGLMFWGRSATDCYVLLIDAAKRFTVFKKKGGKFTTLIKWTSTAAIKADKAAPIGVDIVDVGNNAYLLINGKRVGQVTAPSDGAGDLVGLLCQSADRAAATCRFSRIAVTAVSAAVVKEVAATLVSPPPSPPAKHPAAVPAPQKTVASPSEPAPGKAGAPCRADSLACMLGN